MAVHASDPSTRLRPGYVMSPHRMLTQQEPRIRTFKEWQIARQRPTLTATPSGSSREQFALFLERHLKDCVLIRGMWRGVGEAPKIYVVHVKIYMNNENDGCIHFTIQCRDDTPIRCTDCFFYCFFFSPLYPRDIHVYPYLSLSWPFSRCPSLPLSF